MSPLAEKIVLAHSLQLSRAPPAWLVTEPTHDANRYAIKLAADQARRASQFIGHSFRGGVENVAVRVTLAAIVEERLHSGYPDGNFYETFAPCPTERIRDDHRHLGPGFLLDDRTKAKGRFVRLFRQKQCVFAAIHVGEIDARVGADHTVMGFGDQHAVTADDLLTNNRAALAQGEFDDAGIYSRLL